MGSGRSCVIRVGIIGMGYMGGVHLRNWRVLQDVQVVAVCDARPIIDSGTQGNISAGTGSLSLEGVTVDTEITEMLAMETLDAVSITLPTHLHRAVSIQALEAGVHVLCEKPMALSLEDCDAMIAASQQAGKRLMIAHCIRFWPQYVRVKECAESGIYGRVAAAGFSRLSAAPGWDSDSWFADPARSGGIALDLHIHDLDFIQWLLGPPERIRAGSVPLPNGMEGHIETLLDYPGGCVVTASASWMMPESFGFSMTFKVIFEQAAMIFDGKTLTIYPSEGEPFIAGLPEENGYLGEIRYFAECISGQSDCKEVITPEQARESVRMALETIAS